jgi:hypothetical protein
VALFFFFFLSVLLFGKALFFCCCWYKLWSIWTVGSAVVLYYVGGCWVHNNLKNSYQHMEDDRGITKKSWTSQQRILADLAIMTSFNTVLITNCVGWAAIGSFFHIFIFIS